MEINRDKTYYLATWKLPGTFRVYFMVYVGRDSWDDKDCWIATRLGENVPEMGKDRPSYWPEDSWGHHFRETPEAAVEEVLAERRRQAEIYEQALAFEKSGIEACESWLAGVPMAGRS